MIIDSKEDGLLLVTQVDHADLSGQLAASWGNGVFAKPQPWLDMVQAAYLHDAGWAFRDYSAPVSQETGQLCDFREWPMKIVLQIHHDTVEWVQNEPSYTRLMVSMHRTGLCQNRYSTHLGWERRATDRPQPEVRQFVAQEEMWQRKMKRALAKDRKYKHYTGDRWIWTNYELIQVWDRLSLYLCGVPGHGELFPTPTKYGGKDVGLTLKDHGGRQIKVEPWPFKKRPLRVSTIARYVKKKRYRDVDHAMRAFYAAPTVHLDFKLT